MALLTRVRSAVHAGRVRTPWFIMLASAALTYICLAPLAARNPLLTSSGNRWNSAAVLLVTALISAWNPATALSIALGLYLPIWYIGMIGWMGYAMFPYMAVVIAFFFVCRQEVLRRRSPIVPGTRAAFCLAALVFAQWFRSGDMKDSASILCDVAAFSTLFWKLPSFAEAEVREAAQSFVLGIFGSSVVLLCTELFRVARLADSLHFNPDGVGYAAGVALILTISGVVFRNKLWLRFCIAPVLIIVLYFSGGRTAFYAAGLSVVITLWFERRHIALYLAGCTLLASLYFLRGELTHAVGLAARMLGPFTERFSDSSARRQEIWSYLIAHMDRYWIGGVGLGNTDQVTGPAGLLTSGYALQTHNVYLTLVVELGILGVGLFAIWQVTVLAAGIKNRSRMVMLVPLLLYFSIAGFFDGLNLSLVVGFMIVAGYRLQQQPMKNWKVQTIPVRQQRMPVHAFGQR